MIRIKCTDETKESPAILKVLGLGGAGGNAVNRMVEAGLRGVELIAANTDAQVLRHNKAGWRVQLGENTTRGLGAGGSPARGKEAALESLEQIREVVAGADMVFITTGMGGGTGTGGAPVVARVAKEEGVLSVGVVSRPFEFEGRLRSQQAEHGIQELREHVDTLLIIPNDRIFGVIDDKTTSQEAFRRADDVLRQAIQAISDLITTAGDINVDFADIKSILTGAGEALMGIGEKAGPNRALEAAKAAVKSPLLENVVMDGAQRMIVNITGSKSTMTLAEIKEAMEFIHRQAGPEANVKHGQAYDETLGEMLKVTVVAAGFPPRKVKKTSREFRGVAPRFAPLPEAKPGKRADGTLGFADPDWSKPAFLSGRPRKLK